jgi:hypothetical protein
VDDKVREQPQEGRTDRLNALSVLHLASDCRSDRREPVEGFRFDVPKFGPPFNLGLRVPQSQELSPRAGQLLLKLGLESGPGRG